MEISAADGQPTVISKINLPATVPPGFSVAGIGQVNGLGAADLLVRNATTGQQLILTLTTSLGQGLTGSPQQTSLPLPAYFQVVGAGDLDGDGVGDLLLRDTLNGHLIADLTRLTGQYNAFVDLGNFTPTGSSPASTTSTRASGPDDILFQNAVTGLTYVWVWVPAHASPRRWTSTWARAAPTHCRLRPRYSAGDHQRYGFSGHQHQWRAGPGGARASPE